MTNNDRSLSNRNRSGLSNERGIPHNSLSLDAFYQKAKKTANRFVVGLKEYFDFLVHGDAEIQGDAEIRGDLTVEGVIIGGVPIGTILMFDGSGWVDNSTIPGWYACIAANSGVGCPDLVDSFVKGKAVAGSGTTGGANTVTIASNNLPTHTHTISHTHTVGIPRRLSDGGASPPADQNRVAIGGNNTIQTTLTRTTSAASTTNSGNGGFANDPINNEPEYYTVIFIRRCV